MGCLPTSDVKYNAKCAAFYTSVIFSFCTLCFCFYKLAANDDDKAVYIGILTTILGVFMPSPNFPTAKKTRQDPLTV